MARAKKGVNDLQTKYPHIAAEWHPSKNGDLRPSDIGFGSPKKVFWKCKNGHDWNVSVNSRTSGSTGCPYCANKKAWPGFNDLQSQCPELAKEWHPSKNGDLTPDKIVFVTEQKVWWMCPKGHEWFAQVYTRCKKGIGCPVCSKELRTSFPEYAIMYYVLKVDREIIHSSNDFGFELDIFCPNKRIGIEYDGFHWHKGKEEKEREKNKKCKALGISLYRFREEGLKPLNDTSIDYIVNEFSFGTSIEKLIYNIWKVKISVDIERDRIAIENLREYLDKKNSLSKHNSELAKEWDYIRNGKLTPNKVTVNSTKKVWWKCQNGHSWKAEIHSRNYGSGCPYCSNKLVLSGFNDLKTKNPSLCKEWDYGKNEKSPSEYLENSKASIFWVCKRKHEWVASIYNRNNGECCPFCANRKVWPGDNDLLTKYPDLAKEWHPTKNKNVLPSMVLPSESRPKRWWLGNCGDEWSASVNHRVNGRGCPICANRTIVKGRNDLATINPNLAKEWNYDKNGNLTPQMFPPSSKTKVWWKCKNGHSWESTINNRARGHGCPFCSGNMLIRGKNDLQTLNPKLAKEWDLEHNTGILPSEVTSRSSQLVWWTCEKSHYWKTSVYNRSQGKGCPYCANRKVWPGFNDLQSQRPELAKEWHPSKNGDLTPANVLFGSHQNVWWKGECGHEWLATIKNRNKGTGCPICFKNKRAKGLHKKREIFKS